MPGPSFTWSLFSNSATDAVNVLRGDRIMTLVTERLDESLVVTAHYMRWSLADVVNTGKCNAYVGMLAFPHPCIYEYMF